MESIPANLQGYIIDNLQLGEKIGIGAYGKVIEGKWEGLSVAVKTIHPILYEEANEQEVQGLVSKFLKECENLFLLRHSNIVQFFGICNFDDSPMPGLVMERLDFNLNGLLKQNIVLSYETKSFIIYQIALGLRYLHTRTPPIIHRDLSSKNVVISKSMVAKIVDFGIARAYFPNKTMTKELGVIDFMAPEVFGNSKNTEKIDIFSFGCVTLHTYTEQWPTVQYQPVITDPKTNKNIAISEIDRRKPHMDMLQNNIAVQNETLDLIKSCLENSETKRPSSIEITRHFEKILSSRLKIISAGISGTAPHLKYFEGLDKASSNSIKWWKDMKPNWRERTNLRKKCWVNSVAELNGKVYMAVRYDDGPSNTVCVYDFKQDTWSNLLPLQYYYFSLVAVHKIKRIMAIGGVKDDEVSSKVFTWNEKSWSPEYLDMPTARSRSSSISYESSVIVAGGITKINPYTNDLLVTKAVEVLNINENKWYEVESLPLVAYNTIPIIIGDSVCFGVGYDDYIKPNNRDDSTRNIVTASVSDLIKINDKNSAGLVPNSNSRNMADKSIWKKLPDMPYSSWSINHYKNKLIVFTGDSLVQPKESGEVLCQNVPLIYIYNPQTFSWDCVDDLSGTIKSDFYLGISIHINENTILFMGGITGRHEDFNDIVTPCYTLTFKP